MISISGGFWGSLHNKVMWNVKFTPGAVIKVLAGAVPRAHWWGRGGARARGGQGFVEGEGHPARLRVTTVCQASEAASPAVSWHVCPPPTPCEGAVLPDICIGSQASGAASVSRWKGPRAGKPVALVVGKVEGPASGVANRGGRGIALIPQLEKPVQIKVKSGSRLDRSGKQQHKES